MSRNHMVLLTFLVILIQMMQLSLAAELTGHVIFQNNTNQREEYAQAHLDWNQGVKLSGPLPHIIVFAETVQDVSNAVLYCLEWNLKLAVRSGRHSYEAFSVQGDVILDVTHLKTKRIDRERRVGVFGAGNRLIEVYNEVMKQGFVFPGGTCPTVSLAGFTLGGGYGFLARTYGLACDNLIAIEIVTSKGNVIIANATNEYSDLFWACQGAGNGNFGIITSLTYRLNPVEPQYVIYQLSWPDWSNIKEAFNFWQRFGPNADPRLTSQFTFYHTSFASAGQFVGPKEELERIIKPFSQIGNAVLKITEMTYHDSVLFFSGCENMTYCLQQADWNPLSTSQQMWKGKSTYVMEELSSEGIDVLLHFMGSHFQNSTNGFAGVLIDSLGGKIADLSPTDTAFVHRRAKFHMQGMIYWLQDSERTASLGWLSSFWNSLKPHVSPYSYFNYCDLDVEDYMNAYYGQNVPRLRKIKSKYDPIHFFQYPQGISSSLG